jgi:antibiotic biosynthesis monooxygenase (ABM) superfamily enzyme
MIIRAWNGWTTAENAQDYEDLLNGTIAPGIMARDIPGLRGLTVLRRTAGEATGHFATLMTFDDWAAVAAFAGPDPTGSVVPPAARELLARHDAQSQHFEVVRTHRSAGSSVPGDPLA